MIDGQEECSSLEELAGTPTGRSMGIGMLSYNMILDVCNLRAIEPLTSKKGRGYIAAGILIASLLSLNEFMRFRHRASSKFFILNNEFYILSIGLILAAFNQVFKFPSYHV